MVYVLEKNLKERWSPGHNIIIGSLLSLPFNVKFQALLKVLLYFTLVEDFLLLSLLLYYEERQSLLAFSTNNVQILNDEHDDFYFHLVLF